LLYDKDQSKSKLKIEKEDREINDFFKNINNGQIKKNTSNISQTPVNAIKKVKETHNKREIQTTRNNEAKKFNFEEIDIKNV